MVTTAEKRGRAKRRSAARAGAKKLEHPTIAATAWEAEEFLNSRAASGAP
jgi:hypothetical protein